MTKESNPELFELDLTQSAGLAQIIEEFQALGRVEIVDIITHKGDNHFVADVTGLSGKYEFKVQGQSTIYSLGADTIINILRALDQSSPVMSKAVLAKMQKPENKHYSKLRGANKRH